MTGTPTPLWAALLFLIVIQSVIVVALGHWVSRLLVEIRRANRKVRLLHLWARERRADLARVVSWFFQAMSESDDDDQEHERLKLLEKELRKQARYVGVEWGRIPTPTSGFTQPELLSSVELLEMLELSRELRIPGRAI